MPNIDDAAIQRFLQDARGKGQKKPRWFGNLLRSCVRGLVVLSKGAALVGLGTAAFLVAKRATQTVLASEVDMARRRLEAEQEDRLTAAKAELQRKLDAAEAEAREARQQLHATVRGLEQRLETQATLHAKHLEAMRVAMLVQQQQQEAKEREAKEKAVMLEEEFRSRTAAAIETAERRQRGGGKGTLVKKPVSRSKSQQTDDAGREVD